MSSLYAVCRPHGTAVSVGNGRWRHSGRGKPKGLLSSALCSIHKSDVHVQVAVAPRHRGRTGGLFQRALSSSGIQTALAFFSSDVTYNAAAALPLYGQEVASTSDSITLPIASLVDVIFQVTNSVDGLVSQELESVSAATYIIVLLAGLATSLSPCTLSVLPLTIGYIGGYSTEDDTPVLVKAATFSAGLATTLALLGVVSTAIGTAYGQTGDILPILVSLVAMAMGLNLLGVLKLQLPSLDVDVRSLSVPPLVQAYLAGLTFALAASPCSTPVLATLLAFVSTQDEPIVGASLLLVYSLGYVAPLLVAASATGAMKKVLTFRQFSTWVTPASGALLLAGGTYTMILRLI